MSTITLVRHGQANTGARDEDSYDRLSPLGHQQAAWLGAHFDAVSEPFSQVVTGTLRRHRETAQSIGHHKFTEDAGFNELEYFTMAQIAEAEHGMAPPQGREEFQTHLPALFDLWSKDALPGAPERFSEFQARVQAALDRVAAHKGPTLVVTSGGVVAMVLRLTLGLDVWAMARACLSIQNSSVHRWEALPAGLALAQFNAVPHLEAPDRRFAQTHL